ncbi:hypothetical protein JTB14_003801 [Gonioctena quinquepunctata]|nr:hypothetical protein JTB14_003801 [Gonioctena quinquepunctata]
MRPSRISRDNCDIEKLDMWLAGHNPPDNKELMSIGTGVIANENIYCHRAYEIGREMMTKIIGADFGSLSFRRKDEVLSLSAVNTSITIDESPVPIDPLLLFQRMCITKNSETDLKKFLAYELAPFPLSLFTEEGMRKGTKSLLYNAFEPLTGNFQPGDRHHHIIDGGFLLHKVVWGRVETFDLICKKYVAYVQQHFGETVTIVFDGYPTDMRLAGTKTSERARRSRKNQSPEFTFDETTTPKISQEKFLARDQNKNNLIQMLRLNAINKLNCDRERSRGTLYDTKMFKAFSFIFRIIDTWLFHGKLLRHEPVPVQIKHEKHNTLQANLRFETKKSLPARLIGFLMNKQN